MKKAFQKLDQGANIINVNESTVLELTVPDTGHVSLCVNSSFHTVVLIHQRSGGIKFFELKYDILAGEIDANGLFCGQIAKKQSIVGIGTFGGISYTPASQGFFTQTAQQ